MQAEFLVAGTMSITVVEAKRLRKSNKAVGRQDPYVVLKMDGKHAAKLYVHSEVFEATPGPADIA